MRVGDPVRNRHNIGNYANCKKSHVFYINNRYLFYEIVYFVYICFKGIKNLSVNLSVNQKFKQDKIMEQDHKEILRELFKSELKIKKHSAFINRIREETAQKLEKKVSNYVNNKRDNILKENGLVYYPNFVHALKPYDDQIQVRILFILPGDQIKRKSQKEAIQTAIKTFKERGYAHERAFNTPPFIVKGYVFSIEEALTSKGGVQY